MFGSTGRGCNESATPIRTFAYDYDLAGNRTSAALNGTPTSYTYNNRNQLTSDGTHTFGYDKNGNRISDGTLSTVWDRAGRMLSHDGHGYAYDGEGRRIAQTAAGSTTRYVLDVQRGLPAVIGAKAGSDITHYMHGPLGMFAQRNPDSSWDWMLHDGLGSVRGVFDGTLQSAAEYDPFGEPIVAPIGTAYGFTGELTDGNGLVYLRARYLAPSLGTFASRDPWRGSASAPRTWNGYAWVEGNVVNRVDASGMAAGIAACESSAPLIEALKTTARSSTEYDGVSHYTRGIGLSATMPFPYSDDEDDKTPLFPLTTVETRTPEQMERDRKLCEKWANDIKRLLENLLRRISDMRLDRHNLWDIRLLDPPQNSRIINGKYVGTWKGHRDQAVGLKSGIETRIETFKNGPPHAPPCRDPDNHVSSTQSVLATIDIEAVIPDRVAQQEQSDQPQTPPDPIPFQQVPVDPLYIPCDAACQLARWLLLIGAAGGLAGGAILRVQ
ncbi:MAG: RHS repeat-associated core domain-containing protein [Chloroflexi bacterium]|nr:RHS repeat-associated core domain-containing protein [Chloroflexota bacterium]